MSAGTKFVAAVAVCLLAAACNAPSDGGDDGVVNAQPPASASPRPSFDPPTRFDPARAVRLPGQASAQDGPTAPGRLRGKDLPVVLYGTTLYIATSQSLLRVDTNTGQVVDTVAAPTRQANLGARFYPPTMALLDGVPTVLVTFSVTIPGSGTTRDSYAVEIHAVAAEDGKPRWSFEIPTPSNTNLRIVGVSGNMLLLSDPAGPVAYGVDLATQKVVWQREEFSARVVDDGLVIGVDDPKFARPRAMALRMSDGTEQWSDAESSVAAPAGTMHVLSAGPGRVMIAGQYYRSGNYYYRIADTRTGHGEPTTGRRPFTMDCWFDEVSVTVCSGDGVFAFDVATGEKLWALPDEKSNRMAPEVTAAWHGAVYGRTSNGPLVLDARTGADREVSAGAAPIIVNEYVGIATINSMTDLYAIPPVA